MTECSASVAGGKEILLFCEKVNKDDIEIRFFQEVDGRVVWEGHGDFQPSDVHKQYGICFRTPRYTNLETEENIAVKMQLRRPSDGAVSDPRPFDFTPIDGGRSFWAAKRMKTNYAFFQDILNNDHQERRRKIPGASPLASPDSSTMHHVLVPAPAANCQITQPIQLVHASTFPPPPSPVKHASAAAAVTCATPELPPPPTPLIPDEAEFKVPPKAATMNLHSISNVNLSQQVAPEPAPVQESVLPVSNSYEDIGQAVYDDVDTKYDQMDFSQSEPPLPPVRKRPVSTSINTIPPFPIEEPSRPLPETPSKKSSLISKLKPKPKKAKEEAVQPDMSAPGENGNRPAASLFQRLFNRSKSVEQKAAAVAQGPPTVPLHRDDNGNENLDDIQNFIDEGNLEQLDNMVTEFAMNMSHDNMDEVKS